MLSCLMSQGVLRKESGSCIWTVASANHAHNGTPVVRYMGRYESAWTEGSYYRFQVPCMTRLKWKATRTPCRHIYTSANTIISVPTR